MELLRDSLLREVIKPFFNPRINQYENQNDEFMFGSQFGVIVKPSHECIVER